MILNFSGALLMRGVRLLKGDEINRMKNRRRGQTRRRNFFWKAFRILGLDETRGSWVVETDFLGNFQVNVTLFLPFSPVSLTELCSFWYDLKDLFTLPK